VGCAAPRRRRTRATQRAPQLRPHVCVTARALRLLPGNAVTAAARRRYSEAVMAHGARCVLRWGPLAAQRGADEETRTPAPLAGQLYESCTTAPPARAGPPTRGALLRGAWGPARAWGRRGSAAVHGSAARTASSRVHARHSPAEQRQACRHIGGGHVRDTQRA
jgi:hypothetical protein